MILHREVGKHKDANIIAPVNVAKVKSTCDLLALDQHDKQKRHNHPKAFRIKTKIRTAMPPPMIRVVPPTSSC